MTVPNLLHVRSPHRERDHFLPWPHSSAPERFGSEGEAETLLLVATRAIRQETHKFARRRVVRA